MKNENRELHVIIIWEKARSKEEEILNDINRTFNILTINKITWSKQKAYLNFSRFYAIKSRYARSKLKHCGSGEFIMVVIEDLNPVYEIRETGDGQEKVNINLFDKKTLYRKWTGEGHKIHASNTLKETKHNIGLFFGQTITEYLDSIQQKENYYQQDLVGTNGWKDFREVFKIMNLTMNYICLRNFEGFFNNIEFNEHLDIDLLVNNYEEAKLILNSTEVYKYNNRVVNQVKISGHNVDFDLRYIGDGYMCREWENDLLLSRYCYENKYYRPSELMYFYSLLYHVLVHKEKVAKDYLIRLENMSSKFNIDINEQKLMKENLMQFMTNQNYVFTEPNDMSVFYNYKLFNMHISTKRTFLLKYRKIKQWIKRLIYAQ